MKQELKINFKNLNKVFYETLIYFIIVTAFFAYENVNYKYYIAFYSPIYITLAIFSNYLLFEINRKITIDNEYIIVEKKNKTTRILKSELLETYQYKGKYDWSSKHFPFAHFEYVKLCTKNETIIITNLRKHKNFEWRNPEKKINFLNFITTNNPYLEKLKVDENFQTQESYRIKKLSEKFENKTTEELEKINSSEKNEYTRAARKAAINVIKKRKANNI